MKKIRYFFAAVLLFVAFGVHAQDLAIFDVHGPVKSIRYEYSRFFFPQSGEQYDFNRKGRWTNDERFDYKSARDKRGRVVRYGYEDVQMDNTQFYFNRRGKVSWTFHVWPDDEGCFRITNVYYNRRGDVVRLMQRCYGGHTFNRNSYRGADSYQVKIVKRDNRGNWIKRHLYSGDRNDPIEEVRHIRYY